MVSVIADGADGDVLECTHPKQNPDREGGIGFVSQNTKSPAAEFGFVSQNPATGAPNPPPTLAEAA